MAKAKTKTTEAPSNSLRPKRILGLFTRASGFDMTFFVLTMLILVVGLVSLFSASYAYSYYQNSGDSYYYISKQLVFAVIGVFFMLLISLVDYHVLHKFALWVMGIAWLLLGLVLILPAVQNVHRWIPLPGFNVQPSEIAKFAIILLFAHLISLFSDKMKLFTKGYLPFMGILLFTCGLVFIEPHLSGTILIMGIGLVMMYIGGTRGRWLLLTIAIGALSVILMVFVLGYEQDRITVWQDPLAVYTSDAIYEGGQTGRDVAWQTVQSLYAIGSGGFMGEGLGNSRQKHLFLPEPQNDFIFAIVCEELGFIGALAIIILFALLVWRGFVIGMRASDKFGSLLAIGLTTQIGMQVILNIAVVTNAMPNTGISLPFFSYGGSSLVMLLAQMGVVLSVSRQAHLRRDFE